MRPPAEPAGMCRRDLALLDRIVRADRCARAAFQAQIRVDHIGAFTFRDRVCRAFCCTAPAGDAFIRNFICHVQIPPSVRRLYFNMVSSNCNSTPAFLCILLRNRPPEPTASRELPFCPAPRPAYSAWPPEEGCSARLPVSACFAFSSLLRASPLFRGSPRRFSCRGRFGRCPSGLSISPCSARFLPRPPRLLPRPSPPRSRLRPPFLACFPPGSPSRGSRASPFRASPRLPSCRG